MNARFALVSLFALGVGLAVPDSALARRGSSRDVKGGLGMDHVFAASLYRGGGSRSNLASDPKQRKFGDGSQWVVRIEAAGLYKPTVFGNWGGMEGGMDLGWERFDSFKKDEMAMYFDCWWGFPVTVVRLGDADQQFGLVLGVAPGVGMNTFNGGNAYAYIKGRLGVTLVPNVLQGEVSYQWHPMDTSVNGDGEGFNHATLRTQLFYSMGSEGQGVQFYVDLDQASHEKYVQNQVLNGAGMYEGGRDPLLGQERLAYQRLWRAGLGFVF